MELEVKLATEEEEKRLLKQRLEEIQVDNLLRSMYPTTGALSRPIGHHFNV